MKGKIELLEVQLGRIRTEWGRPDLTPGSSLQSISFLEFQLIRLGFDTYIASSVAESHPEIETLAELLEVLE